MRVIYIDALFIVNLLLDYLMLCVSARLTGETLRRGRILLASAVGGAVAVFMFFQISPALLSIPVILLGALLMSAISFGAGKLLRNASVLAVSSFALSGCSHAVYSLIGENSFYAARNGVVYVNLSVPSLIIASFLSYILLGVIMKRRLKDLPSNRTVHIRLGAFGGMAEFDALLDTGNTLVDPVSQRRIMVVHYGAIRELFPPAARAVLDDNSDETESFLTLSGVLKGIMLVPYKTVGGSSLMLAFRPSSVDLDGNRKNDVLIGISREEFTDKYAAVVGI